VTQKPDPSISFIALSEVIVQKRIDSEYFQPEFLEVATRLRSADHKRLEDLSTIVTSAFYPAAADLYEYGDIPFIRGVDVINYPVITNDQPFERIPLSFIRESKGIQELHTGDIVITKVGTPCYAGILHEDLKHCALSRTVLGVKDIDTEVVDPYYLVVFLRCKYGFFQLMREREQQIQLQLTLDRVGRINVFLPEKAVQVEIGNILRKYHQQIVLSQDLYRQAEQLLLDELGLSDLELPAGLHNDAPISKAWEAHRIDAEYYQPRYEYLDQVIQSASATVTPLGSLIHPIINGFDWRDFAEDGTPYIRVGDVYKDRIDLDNAFRVAISPEEVGKPVGLQVGDILFTRKGTFGQAAVVDERASSTLISSEIMRLRLLDPSAVHPQYLSLYLNSVLGYTQVEQRVHGAGFYSISQEDLGQILICVPGWETQEKIADEAAKSHTARHQAKALLEQARRKVEAMIESEVAHG